MKHLKYFEKTSKDIDYWLFISAIQNDLKGVKYHLEHGANINTIDGFLYNDGKTPLIVATSNGYKLIVEYLLEQHADTNIQANNGNTALIYAIGKDYDEYIVKKLIDAGADVNISNNNGNSPLIEAAIMSSYIVLKMLIDAGANWTLKNNQNADFYSFLTHIEKNRIKSDYPEKYEEYKLLKYAEDEYNL